MHCDCCNEFLTNLETRIRFKHSGNLANTCLKCLKTMEIPYKLPRTSDDTEDEEHTINYTEPPEPLYDEGELWDER